MTQLLPQYLIFLRRHPLWWLLPPALILALLAALVFLTARDDVAGFVYKL